MIIGLCGKSGCGKSTVSRKLKEILGDRVVSLDIDKVGHRALEDAFVKYRLAYTFGDSILNDGVVDRKRLGNIVFASSEEMDKLSDITWGYMDKEIYLFIKNNSDKIIILDWQLLPKTRYFGMCDLKVLLDVPYEVRLQRAVKRDNISEEAFQLRECASIDYNLGDFDIVLGDSDSKNIGELVKRI